MGTRMNGSDEDVLYGLGPVVLLHLPLDQTRDEHYAGVGHFKRSSNSFMDELNVVPESRLMAHPSYELHLIHFFLA